MLQRRHTRPVAVPFDPSDNEPADPEPAAPRQPAQASGLRALAAGAVSVAKAVPIVGPAIEFTETELERAEDVMWRQVRHRMDTVAPPEPTNGVVKRALPARQEKGADDLAALLADLLVVSTEQSADAARQRLHLAVLRELQPDEARILAALSDGTRYAVLHVVVRLHLGGSGPALLENASTVGRAAGVALPDMVPWYVGHLLRLGWSRSARRRPTLPTPTTSSRPSRTCARRRRQGRARGCCVAACGSVRSAPGCGTSARRLR
jgi:hypothetical protein